MLQINSGKLFTNGIGTTNLLRGVLYSNLKLPRQIDVETAAGTLRETGGSRGSQAIVYELQENIEESESGPGLILSHTVNPYMQDFSAVASFALNVIISPDPELTIRLTNGTPGLSSYNPPRDFIRRCYDERVSVSPTELAELTCFVDQLLALPRRTFLGVMRAIRTFVAGIHRVADDLGLAYTLMVSAIESLAQDFDRYQSTWLDVDERKRQPVEKALKGSPAQISEAIRNAILSVEHVSLSRRYREFVLSHVGSSYFRDSDALIGNPLTRSEIEQALKQAYSLRSKYVHNIQPLPDALKNPFSHWETVYVDRQATLTLQGISRLTRHVIKSFVFRCPTVCTESYNYTHELAGVMTAPLAPEYWISHPLRNSKDAHLRLEGFLEQYVKVLGGAKGAAITDVRSVLADIERMLPGAAKEHKSAMIVLHAMFNLTVMLEDRTPGWEKFINSHSDALRKATNETLVARTMLRTTAVWPLQQHRAIHDKFFSQRSKQNGLHVPRQIDAAISLELAERYRLSGQWHEAKAKISDAVENFPNHPHLAAFEKIAIEDTIINWNEILFPRASDS